MRIAFFTDSYKPQVNGLVSSVSDFAKELRKKNTVYIFSPSTVGEKHCYASPSLPFPAYSGYRVGMPYNLLGKHLAIDLIHVHSPFTMGMAGMAIAKARRLPLVGTFHTMFPEYLHYVIPDFLMRNRATRNAVKQMSWSFLRAFYNRCNAVIAPTEAAAKVLKKHGIKNVRVIPTGIDFTKRSFTKNMKRKLGITGKMILHVGRVTKEKKINFLMDALSTVNATFVIASDGPCRKELESRAPKNVIFTGYLPEKNLRGLYEEADAFVMASQTETQGLVLLEAASHGVPCVVLDEPVISDFVRENETGIVATKKGFADAVKNALGNGKKINRRALMRKYDIRKCTKELEELYKEMQKRPGNKCKPSRHDDV